MIDQRGLRPNVLHGDWRHHKESNWGTEFREHLGERHFSVVTVVGIEIFEGVGSSEVRLD